MLLDSPSELSYIADFKAPMGTPLSLIDRTLAKLRRVEARKALDGCEAIHGSEGSIELQRLEREFSRATERYRKMIEEER